MVSVCVREREREQHTCNIIYNNCYRGVPDIARNETPESFLPSSVPVLKYQKFMLQLTHGFGINKKHKITENATVILGSSMNEPVNGCGTKTI